MNTLTILTSLSPFTVAVSAPLSRQKSSATSQTNRGESPSKKMAATQEIKQIKKSPKSWVFTVSLDFSDKHFSLRPGYDAT